MLATALFAFPPKGDAQLTFEKLIAFRQTALAPISIKIVDDNAPRFFYRKEDTPKLKRLQGPTVVLTLMDHPTLMDHLSLGWFCQLDLHLDKTMKWPLRFRLGTLDYVNRREGYYDQSVTPY